MGIIEHLRQCGKYHGDLRRLIEVGDVFQMDANGEHVSVPAPDDGEQQNRKGCEHAHS